VTEARSSPRPTGLVLALFWGSVVLSLVLPWGLLLLFEVSAHRRTFSEAFRYLSLHWFAPGYHYFLVGLLSAAPFTLCAAFLLLHLGRHPALGRVQFSRRLAGVLGSLVLMFGVSFWTHLSALMHPDGQGALVYFFLPFILLVLLPLGYGLGRLTLAFMHVVRPGDKDPVESLDT
jgi:hypothetical protein